MRKKRIFTTRSNQEIKCRLDIPRTWYESKLQSLEAEPKTDSNRAAVYQMRCKLRYYDTHIEEANKLTEFKRDVAELRAWKEVFREHNGKKLWHQCVTIEKMVKEKGIEAWPVVKHALEVAHRYFGRG